MLEVSPQEAAKEAKIKPVTVPKDEPKFFAELEFLKQNPQEKEHLPADFKELLSGPDAFAAAFLSAGWTEAALQLNTLETIPHTYPDWVAFELAQATRQNRGATAAMEFADKQSPTPAMTLMIGELLAANGKPDQALDRLTKLTQDHNDIGYKASWLVSLIYIERGQYNEAKEAIEAQPALAKDLVGQETLARIALLQGNTVLAEQLYSAIESKSAEAKSYLARKAYAEKNWKKARELTEQLLLEYPTNALLQENLKKIIDEQNKAKSTK